MSATPKFYIPSLRSWSKQGKGYQYFKAGLGYLDIKPTSQGFTLTRRADLDGVEVGAPRVVGRADTAAELAEVARLEFNTPSN